MDPLVTIIVPMYNASEYLERCVDSILNQDYTNLEVLLIDDGSTDATPMMLARYQRKDPRVRVLRHKNQGVSASRNRGLDCARGKYIQFADCDDWLTPDATKLMVRAAEQEQCDMIIANFYRVTGKTLSEKGDIDADQVMNRVEFASYMIENPADFYYGVLWNKLFRRDLIEEHHIRMDEDLDWCEDFLFNLEYIRYAERLFAVQAPVYYYVKRKGSLVSQGSSISATVKMKITVFDYYNDFYRAVYEENYDDVKRKVRMFLVSSARDGFVPPAAVSGSTRLGRERLNMARAATRERDNLLTQQYCLRKLTEYHLGLASTLKKITPAEGLLLLLFHDVLHFENVREIADLAGITPPQALRALQRLKRRELIEYTNDPDTGVTVSILEKAWDCMEQISRAVEEMKEDLLAGFSPAEAQALLALEDHLRQNVLTRLRQIENPAWELDGD